MVVIHKDIKFANIPDVEHGECHLDLYLPDKLTYSNEDVPKPDLTEESSQLHYSIQDVRGDSLERSDIFSTVSDRERDDLLSFEELTNQRTESPDSKFTNGRCSGVPFVLFIHGGGWRRGGKAAWKHFLYFDVNFLVSFLQYMVGTYGNIGETLAVNGIACAVISYPLAEAGHLVLIFEMILSYIQCVFFVAVSFLPVFGCTMFYRTFGNTNHAAYELIFKEYNDVDILRAYFILVLVSTHAILVFLIFFKQNQFRISVNEIKLFTGGLLATVAIVIQSKNPVLLFIVLTLVITQGLIFYKRLQRHGCTYDTQIKAVAKAVEWAKCFSQETDIIDINRLYMMGHSAGGHLATILALDESILSSVDCSISDIKGVISISGVYDLFCLNKHFLRHVYLIPAFGGSSSTWMKASPNHVAKETTATEKVPKFLLILAEKDMFLRAQSFKFSQTLTDLQYSCQHVEISNTNHFNIITGSNTERGSALAHVLDFVK